MMIREATPDDKTRVIEMAARFLLETRYGALFDDAATPAAIGKLVDQVMNFGAIFVAEVFDNPYQARMRSQLDAMTEDERRRAVMAMSTTQKAILNWGDDYGPDKPRRLVVGMLAIVVVPHPLTGIPYADEIAWWVEPEHRAGSVGPKLLRSAEEWATRNRANMVKMVAPAGSSVGGFYERSGYQAVETAYIKRI